MQLGSDRRCVLTSTARRFPQTRQTPVGFLSSASRPALVFAVGCVPPLNDMPPVPIGLWPFLWIFRILSHGPRLAAWATASAQLPFELAFPAWGIAMMFIAYPPPVYLGWTIENDDPAANH